MVNRKQGTPREIATQGLSSPDGLGIATQGFIEPILGDLIFGGQATVNFQLGAIVGSGGITLGGAADAVFSFGIFGNGGLITGGDGLITINPRYVGSGGITLGGAADYTYSIIPTVGGNIAIGGGAIINTTFNVFPNGGLITDGSGRIEVSYDITGNGGLINGGTGDVVYQPGTIVGAGGIVIGGSAIINTNVGPREFGRGGARSTRRVPRLPNTNIFEPPIYRADDYLQPMDYLKKIQDVLDQAERDKLNILRYLSKGTIKISGRGRVIAVFRDQPDGEMVIANNPPLVPIELDLPNVFSRGITAIEIAELEDHLFLNDLLGLGNYKIKVGPKARYIHHKKKTTGGQAKVGFVSGASKVKHVNMGDVRRRREDDEFLLDLNLRSRQEQEEEELRMLGIID